MAALVQSYSQQGGTATMLQSRAPPTAAMISVSQSTSIHPYTGASNQAPRSVYTGSNGALGYRGGAMPAQPYAFASTATMNPGLQRQQQQQHPGYRVNSSAVPTAQTAETSTAHRTHRQNASVTNMALLSSYGSRDDAATSQSRTLASQQLRQSLAKSGSQTSLTKASRSSRKESDRQMRSSFHAGQHSRPGSAMQYSSTNMSAKTNQLYHAPSGSRSVPNLSASYFAAGDANSHRRASPDESRKLHRRSLYSSEATDTSRPALKGGDIPRTESAHSVRNTDKSDKSPRIVPLPPKAPSHHRNASSDSTTSSRSNHSRSHSASNRNGPVLGGTLPSNTTDELSAKIGHLKPIAPARSSSADAVKRTLSPSPLSKPATMANESPSKSSASSASSAVSDSKAAAPNGQNLNSPAAKQLAAISQKGGKPKSKTSRLRRAFSFGSAAEFREVAGVVEDAAVVDKNEPSKLHKDPTPDQAYNAEQARIVEAQEAGGIGSNIYGGRFFGSTDNLSISSTASSASIMIRKMGRGVKSRTRSFVGLFRPKSNNGAGAADGNIPETSEPTVSMVNAEAEAQQVNVTADPRTGKGGQGGIGFPHLERNSLDASQVPELGSDRLGSSDTENSAPRKSILGGDRERAEVLAAVRKGILKRASSPSVRATESPDLVPPGIPATSDSPNSSTPSTPVDDAQGHRRAGSIAIGNEDYFISALRLRQDSKSRPETPQAVAKRNATFSPRIVFYDTWPSQEYDRRGEIATCNRLTPVLAQQIKEELNSFKMEMEVHENSKIYTHFF